MAIFAVRSTKNVNGDSNHNNPPSPTKGIPTPNNLPARPTATAPEQVIQFDDDMAHFVTHLDADPLAESQVKMHLVEYNYPIGASDPMIREISDDEDDYTYSLLTPYN
jgi:hypothetical protein